VKEVTETEETAGQAMTAEPAMVITRTEEGLARSMRKEEGIGPGKETTGGRRRGTGEMFVK